MAKDPEILAHQEWLGYVQPVGLVVSIPALCQAQCYVNKNIAADHQRFLDCLPADEDAESIIKDFPAFTQKVLGWEPADLIGAAGADPIPDSLRVALAAYGEILEPTYAVRDPNPKDAAQPWMLLISVLPAKQPFDKDITDDDRQWKTTPQARFERLLRETHVPAGLLFNGTHIRLVYAPRGENSGNITFSVADMAKVAGRPIFAALHELLRAARLFTMDDKQRLPTILIESRKYQNTVSTQLAEQVLAALYDLLRGFQAGDNHRHGDLLRDVLAEDPNHVFNGLLTVLMRLVFILYAEDRGLLSTDPVFANFYSITGLFERLRADDGRHHDTMDRRYGAWAQFLTLFRLIYDGGSHGALKIPARRGYLFDPERYRFLEGKRELGVGRSGVGQDARDSAPPPLPTSQLPTPIPMVSDGVIFRVLSNLLILDGERLSYRTLDVEQIGSVYEVMMGFGLGIAEGPTIAIKPKKPLGAPVPINLDALLAVAGGERAKWFKANTDQDLTGEAATAIKTAATVPDALAALERRIAHYATPAPIPKGGMVAIPSDERRRSGSNYTPRSLTEPIVRKTLEPILARLRGELGDGSLGVGKSAASRKDSANERANPFISGSSGLASRHGSGRGKLQNDQELSTRGDVRTDESDKARSGGDSSEHRRGTRPGVSQGISAISEDVAGKPAGVGNASAFVTPGGASQRSADATTDENGRPIGTDDASAAAIAQGKGSGIWEVGGGEKKQSGALPTPPPISQIPSPPLGPTPQQILDLKVCDPAVGSGAFLVEACRQLGDELVKAWHTHKQLPKLPPDEDEVLHARRLVAQRCLYGVDRNPMAADLAKLSLWLATLAKDHPFTFLDHSIRCGDSLVGLTRKQISEFHWKPDKQMTIGQQYIQDRIRDATAHRKRILDSDDALPFEIKQAELNQADSSLDGVRFFGDLIIAGFFGAETERQRIENRNGLLGRLSEYLRTMNLSLRPTDALEALVTDSQVIKPFHWEIEFPEVFDRTNGGFDGIIGNPPFVGGKRISAALGTTFRDWLRIRSPGSSSNVDLCGHFHSLSEAMLRKNGAYGLISTERILIGESKTECIDRIAELGTFFDIVPSAEWPGEASVTISILWFAKSKKTQSGGEQSGIAVNVDDVMPKPLKNLPAASFVGCALQGMGFVLEAGDNEQLVTAKETGVVYPFLISDDINSSPSCEASRRVIFFRNMSLEDAERYPKALAMVRRRVKPYRDTVNRDAHRKRWWQFGDWRPGLYAAISDLDYTFAVGLTSKHLAFCRVRTAMVFDQTTVVVASDDWSLFPLLSAAPHLFWALRYGANMGGTPRYNPTRCFQTYPFPQKPESIQSLAQIGKNYYEFRARLMIQNNEGLTKTYNRFHDPNERSAEIAKLRELHDAMDRAVLDAYGWTDLKPTCEFLLDYEEEEDDTDTQPSARGRKKPWRYRWPDEIRDEVLARLLALNQQRAEQERLTGLTTAPAKPKPKDVKKVKKGEKWQLQSEAPPQPGLPGFGE